MAAGERARAAWARLSRSERLALIALSSVLSVGLLLRALLMAAWQPAFVGYTDSSAYLDMASKNVWAGGLHPFGYPLFLRDLHALSDAIWVTVGLQHIFGLLSAVLLWLAVRQTGASRWFALLPAAVVALNGDQMFLEHSILSEPLFILLLSASLYCAARAAGGASPRWAALAGLLLALDNAVRVVALPLIAVLLLWLLLASGGSRRARVRATSSALACALVVLGGCAAIQHHKTGYWGLTTPSGAWNLYARVAPFADCTRFTPPPGTRALCERTPPAKRTQTVEDYLFSPSLSPARQAFAPDAGPAAATPASNRKIASFTRAVVLHQPLDYARSELEGVVAYVTPVRLQFANRAELGADHDLFFHELLHRPGNSEFVRKIHLPWYGVNEFQDDQSLLSSLFDYEKRTRITGGLMATLMLLSLLVPFAPRGRPRQIGILLCLMAWVALITPPATQRWDARFVIPPLAPLSAAAAVGAWQAARLTRRFARVRA